MSPLLFVGQVMACSLLLYLAVGKLMLQPQYHRMWRPPGITPRALKKWVFLVSVIEVVYVVAVVGEFWSVEATLISSTLLFLFLSYYGAVSVTRTGSCHCGGGENVHQSAPRIWVTNAVLFGLIAAEALWGMNLAEVSRKPYLAAAVPVLVYAAAVIPRLSRI